MMRVLFSATSYPRSPSDWQGIFIRRMAEGIAASGSVELRVWAPPGPLSSQADYVCDDGDQRFLARMAEEGGIAHLLRNAPARGAYRGAELVWRLHKTYRRHADWTDVYHVNWLQCALGQFGLRKPVVATVLGSDLALLEKPGFARALRIALRKRRVVLAPNAPWMIEPLRKHFGPDCPEVTCVPFGIDNAWFDVERRPPPDRHVWITVLRLTRAKIGPLFEWTRDFDPKLHEFHLFGPQQEAIEVPPWIHYHGAATPDQLAKEWFPTATGMITLSQHAEGRPQVSWKQWPRDCPSSAPGQRRMKTSSAKDKSGLLVSTREEFNAALARLSDSATGAAMAQHTRNGQIDVWQLGRLRRAVSRNLPATYVRDLSHAHRGLGRTGSSATAGAQPVPRGTRGHRGIARHRVGRLPAGTRYVQATIDDSAALEPVLATSDYAIDLAWDTTPGTSQANPYWRSAPT